jgi:hypothetical protein
MKLPNLQFVTLKEFSHVNTLLINVRSIQRTDIPHDKAAGVN